MIYMKILKKGGGGGGVEKRGGGGKTKPNPLALGRKTKKTNKKMPLCS
jgi:hypothetical protein